MTLIVKIDPLKIDERKIKLCADLIKKGKVIAFPTETVYGLGADCFNERAVKRIFEIKGRPSDNPLIVHIATYTQLRKVVKELPLDVVKLMELFWPGPITFVLKKRKEIPDIVTANLDTVAVRMPSHKVARNLIEKAGPIAAPSANLSGKPSPTSFQHVFNDLYGKVDCIIDSGTTTIGLESTVVLCTQKPYKILRPGYITLEDLKEIIKDIEYKDDIEKPLSPGMKYKHYAPDAEMIIITGSVKEKLMKIEKILEESKDKKIGLCYYSLELKEIANNFNFSYFLGNSYEQIALSLFSSLREMDNKNVELILFEGVEEKGLGYSIMNRLKKASGYNIL